jgi:uncharacterized protein YecE (DUF72 family)
MNVRKRLQYYTGCSGWSYGAWKGPFYPSNSENSNWLKYYSHIFNYVEIDSSFYKTPNIFMVNNWSKKTPKDFKFTAKFPKAITHDKRLKEVDEELDLLFEAIGGLSDKTLTLLMQLPPSLQIHEGLQSLRELVPQLDSRFRYAIEVRHRSWFQDLAYSFFSNNDICLVWSQLDEIKTPPVVTTDFLYLGLIGDRSIQEKDFGRIQIDRIAEMRKWARNFKKVEEEEEEQVKLSIVAANNHYTGFGPGTVNIFRGMLGLSEASWEEKKIEVELSKEEEQQHKSRPQHRTKQLTLTDFLN